ncbi:similar to Saccharomyces cerevisiae YDR272W GLO2 Cytoplasmic glyoxalase II, catalyzes the hydrolysis of S-D-lactoylglutathione into glutathione and D-lactate [Maudiozyma barnettii]|uniref:hydroxyacylglutathione hydrolase n=1 Tax=Maudiozyma barnettii TaxID=61262 RepID=A0A8H2ZJ89_9SACH|nr:uncharacterized protein KABA2_09S01364 [Kazachstania barnettii]CAB4256292.1 similar to Saccharomyces cerevisiae YDR272W GLO2 Cytoplasmic glyoxalase II, catalyzes the hydrolysis of S-D-lactoylglutathione into glutathione and D-lactate [Kazachstania barnettii]CAD1784901.1 similar to Saccharomyces cerevisiae YDR272W GLO2 Cytoplasmic glyoxalase II, catalyzes the hydrolysis of S-D-lactoylglutathione into glutathione and D-lactate [Kazachstania barnettii]
MQGYIHKYNLYNIESTVCLFFAGSLLLTTITKCMLLRSVRKMHVKAIKMRWATGGDNYCYLLSTHDKKDSWIIDPAETLEILPKLDQDEMKSIRAIVNTHHHYDHSQGNLNMVRELKNVANESVTIVAGSKASQGATELPRHGQKYTLGDLEIIAIRTPCHTQDSVCYYVRDPQTNEHGVFTGDTLFTAGCGRFFEGTGSEMDSALNKTLLQSVGEPNWGLTKVYPGHEYTKGNVRFVRDAIYKSQGENRALDELEKFADTHTVTTGNYTLNDELAFNPFMRLDDPFVRQAVGDGSGGWERSKVMDKLREMKNSM